MIRLGDGERLAYEGADLDTIQADSPFAVPWLKHNGIIPLQSDRMTWRNLTRQAVLDADVLGLHGPKKAEPLAASGSWALEAFCERRGGVCSADVHYQLLGGKREAMRIRFARLFGVGSPVLLVTGHDLRAGIRRMWPVTRRVDWLRVPLQVRYFPPCATPVWHYPTRFLEVQDRIRGADLRGWLVLVAAGLIGKPYCYSAKQAGGVVLDIGSIADLWAGFLTRGHGKGVGVTCQRYKL